MLIARVDMNKEIEGLDLQGVIDYIGKSYQHKVNGVCLVTVVYMVLV